MCFIGRPYFGQIRPAGYLYFRGFGHPHIAVPFYDTSDCDEGEFDDKKFTNGNGDVVVEYFRACTGLGTIVDYWLVLTTHDGKRVETLITFPRRRPDYPKVYWVTNHNLHIDIGPIHTFWPGVSKVESIRISYAHSYDEREDE